MNILLIEDDERIAEFLSRGLRAEGYRVEVATTGPDGLECARNGGANLVVLDLMLPGMDGREVCKQLRLAGVETPIIMVTALESNDDVVRGLRVGADDYLTKPFSFDVLLARIEALLRRGQGKSLTPRILQVADVEFDRDALSLRRAGKNIELTSTEYALLDLFMVNEGSVISRAKILESVWGTTKDPLTNIVDVYVRRLRAKLDDGFDPPLIKTVRGRGYRLSAHQD